MCAYFSKAEYETSEAMKQGAKEDLNASKTEFEIMKATAKTYSTKRECSVQEAACLSYFTRTLVTKNISESNFFE